MRPEQTLELKLTYWNRRCGQAGCLTWVPKHRSVCMAHEVAA